MKITLAELGTSVRALPFSFPVAFFGDAAPETKSNWPAEPSPSVWPACGLPVDRLRHSGGVVVEGSSAVLVGSEAEPTIELRFAFGQKHPVTGTPLRVWVKSLPERRWDKHRRAWLFNAATLPAGTLKAAGFTVTFPDGRPARRADRPPVLVPDIPDTGPEPVVRPVPDWFGLALDPYQREGAERVACNRRLLSDEPGLGKTRQALAAAAILGSSRIVILCPPAVVTHWARETEASGIVEKLPAPESDATAGPPRPMTPSDSGAGVLSIHVESGNAPRIAVVRPGRKQPPVPACGAVIVADSTLTARPALLADLVGWRPELMIYDEAHRAMDWNSARSRAARTLAAASEVTICSTGTPIFSQPGQLVPLLDMTGDLGPVFGGRDAFVGRYLRVNRYGRHVPVKMRLPELKEKLDRQVWVRRTKSEVRADLPPKRRRSLIVDVDLALFNAAHAEVVRKIREWLDGFPAGAERSPTDEQVDEWCSGNMGLVSNLRKAAGLAKVPVAAGYIADWVAAADQGDGTFDRPLIVWTHHRPVTEAMATAIAASSGKDAVGVIAGGTPTVERDRLIDGLQAGRLGALICSITAAGTGITLTKASDVLFVETDWTPALVSQAEDRCHRIGQENHVLVTTMVAQGTLDPAIHTVLARKADVLDEVMTGGDHHVAARGVGRKPSVDVLRRLVLEQMASKPEAE